MLSEQVTELLTAFVDGELNQRQREAAMRLLHESSEAREMLRQLQENAHKVKQLPRHKVEPSLVAEIMQAIAEQKAQPKPSLPKAVRRRWLPYVAASMAASVLIGLLGFLYWKHMIDANGVTKDDRGFVKNELPDDKPNPKPGPTPRMPNQLVDQMVQETLIEFIKQVPIDAPFNAKFTELRDGKKTGQLARELKSDKAIQLDISVKSNSMAMGRLKDVLKDHGIILVTDPSAAKTLADKNQAKVEYLVYAENLTPDEVTKLMRELGESYVVSSGSNQRTVDTQYKEVTVAPIANDEKQRVVKLMGNPADPKDTKQPNLGRQALLLPTLAPLSPSKEVIQFVNKRQALQPGTIQILIKIRQE